MPPKKSATKADAPATKKSTPKATKDATTTAVAKGAAMKAAAASSTGGSAADNTPLIQAFEELMMYEGKANKWASVAYNKVVKILVAHPTKISSSADVAGKDGIGKASIEKIDEFLTTGTIKKLEEHREEYGELPDSFKSAAAGAGGKKLKPNPPSAAIKKKIKEAKDNFLSMSNDNLKSLLKTNHQSTTGTKDELAERCAQGLVMGAIPTCPLCYAGRPRYDIKTGIYKCPGYMDDADFKACFYESQDLKRDPWNNV